MLVPEKIFEGFLNLKLTRIVRSHFVGQSAIHGQIFELFKASVTNSPKSYVIRNTFVIVTVSIFVGNLNSF